MSQFAYTPIQNEDYRVNNITEKNFTSWTQENLYRTSYATSYTDVNHFLILEAFRNHMSPKTASFPAMQASFQGLNPEPSSAEVSPKLLRAVSMTPTWLKTSSASAAQGTEPLIY
jgi:hypothetical protein